MTDRASGVTQGHAVAAALARPFEEEFERLFRELHPRVFGYVNRLCREADLAADIAQEAFVRLHRRGSVPESVMPWLLTVATNLVRNTRSRSARRLELLVTHRDDVAAPPTPDALAAEERRRVHDTMSRLEPREQQLLALLAGGHSYREMAVALGLHEASVGTLLARAKQAFRAHYGSHA
jgi:RNA polymerase sigma factor (sigma-70 family)